MIRKINFLEYLLLMVLILSIHCGVSEPEETTGSIRIQAGDTVTLPKSLETIGLVHCVLMRGTNTIHDGDHTKEGAQFVIEVKELEPADTYSVLLLGENTGGEVIGRGYSDNIRVTAGDVTNVSITWGRFNPALVSPADGSTIDDDTPTFDWSSVGGAAVYALEVDDSDGFSSLEIDQSDLVSSEYTPSAFLADGTYYWHVKSRDSQENWSGWSETWSFTIVTKTVTDIDGNVYQTIRIGSQRWMMENLKVTHYGDGDEIPDVTDNTAWAGLLSGAYCNYNNDGNNVATYGRLYNWYAVNDSRSLAPEGWHVPTDEEWKQLEMYLGMSQLQADATTWRGTNEGGKLKEAGTAHWHSPNTGATNESGFTALPGGYRGYSDGKFYNLENYADFWSSVEYGTLNAWHRELSYGNSGIYRSNLFKSFGFSVRCIRDN